MNESRIFPTLDVVTTTTGVLISDHGIGPVYEVCGHVLGDVLMTHQLPAASLAATRTLVEQHPWLADLQPPRGDLAALKAWAAAICEEHGDTIDVVRAASPDWRRGNALQDMQDIVGDRAKIIAVGIDDGVAEA